MIGRIAAAIGLLTSAFALLSWLALSWENNEKSGNGLSEAAAKISLVAPLDNRPFRAFAANHEDAEAAARGKGLSRALARDPRDVHVRLALAQHYLSSNDLGAAAAELRVLKTLRPSLELTVVTLAAEAARASEGRRAIAAQFAGDPTLLRIMAAASTAGIPPSQLLELLALTRIADIPDGLEQAQSILTRPLLARGEYLEAYLLWRHLLPSDAVNPVFDGDFKGLRGAPPFNWTFTADHHIQARVEDIGSSDGLRIQIFSSEAPPAAEQTVVLSKGRYELVYDYRTALDGVDPPLRWELRCLGGEFVAEDDLEPNRGRWTRGDVRFAIDDGCNSLRLILRPTVSLLRGTPEVLIRNVHIRENVSG